MRDVMIKDYAGTEIAKGFEIEKGGPGSGRKKGASQILEGLRQPEFGVSFSQKMLHYGKENGVDAYERKRLSDSIHTSEAATTREGHKRAEKVHTESFKIAKNSVFKEFHKQMAKFHSNASVSLVAKANKGE